MLLTLNSSQDHQIYARLCIMIRENRTHRENGRRHGYPVDQCICVLIAGTSVNLLADAALHSLQIRRWAPAMHPHSRSLNNQRRCSVGSPRRDSTCPFKDTCIENILKKGGKNVHAYLGMPFTFRCWRNSIHVPTRESELSKSKHQ